MITNKSEHSVLLSRRLTLSFLLISNVFFIFLNSLMPAEVSSENSQSIYDFLLKFFGFIPFFTHTFLRKTAHFVEYALLGFLAFLSVGVFFKGRKLAIPALFAFGLGIAAFDETLQIFSPGRVCSVRDCFIDLMGFIFGLLLSFLFQVLKNRRRRAL